jgi:6-phosphogluconolactonase (cycloisomerase 2 family)
MHRRLVRIALLGLAAVAVLALAGVANAQTIYALSNSPTGNAVLAFHHQQGGVFYPTATYPTGGLGTGAGLGSQGAVVLSKNGKRLYAVNAASNTISAFAVDVFGALELKAVAPSGGTTPISLTVDNQTLYVLNAGGVPGITGFTIGAKSLDPIPGSTRPVDAGPAQVQFSPNGRELVVTNKSANTIDTFLVGANGLTAGPWVTPSAGGTPFGFDFDKHGNVLVSNATGSASSYSPLAAGGLSLITGPVSTAGQAAPCWLVTSADGRYAYTANAGGGSISEFTVGRKGELTLNGATAIGTGSHPLDEAAGSNGFLYDVVDGFHQIEAFRIDAPTGTLIPDAAVNGLPAGAVGLATS